MSPPGVKHRQCRLGLDDMRYSRHFRHESSCFTFICSCFTSVSLCGYARLETARFRGRSRSEQFAPPTEGRHLACRWFHNSNEVHAFRILRLLLSPTPSSVRAFGPESQMSAFGERYNCRPQTQLAVYESSKPPPMQSRRLKVTGSAHSCRSGTLARAPTMCGGSQPTVPAASQLQPKSLPHLLDLFPWNNGRALEPHITPGYASQGHLCTE
jgi:hypothetical protein